MEVGDEPARSAIRTARRMSEEKDGTEEPAEQAYAERLLADVERQRIQIDQLLGGSSTRWRVDRMSPLDLQILRVAVAEFLAATSDLPAPVVIDEAVEVAREFGGDSSPGFVNGVLDAVARELRSGQMNPRTGEGKGG